MAMRQLNLPAETVKKDNTLMRGKLNISNVDSARILASLIAQIPNYETDFQEKYTIKANAFMSGTGGNMYARIEKLCEDLASATAKIKHPSQNKKEPSFSIFTFFRSIKYDNGTITASFNADMKPLLLNLRSCFATYNLMDYLSLPSVYSQKIFEILCSVSNLSEYTITLDELHDILDTPPSFRANFKNFRVFVLNKAYKSIHKETPLKFEWQPIKSGRSVEAIKFLFSAKKKEITANEEKKAKEAKQRRLNNQRFGVAVECAKSKKGICTKQDNKPMVCSTCAQCRICDSLRISLLKA